MNSDINLLGIPENPSKEYLGTSSVYVPKVRGIEETDPVYWQVEDSPLVDLRARDVAIADAFSASLGGYFHEYLSELRNDTVNRFTYGTVNNRITTSDFASTGTPTGYFQMTFGPNVKKTINMYIKLTYVMSTSQLGAVAKITCIGDLLEIGDTVSVPSLSKTWTQEISVPGTQNVISEEILTLTPADLASITDANGVHLGFSIQRLNSGLTGTNHSGDFKLLGITVYQSV